MRHLRTLTPTLARRLAVVRQHLADPTPSALLDIVRDLGCLQLDPINAVARSHYLVMFSRAGQYPLNALDDLIYREKALFEYWAHEASLVLTEDYPIHAYRMRHYPDSTWGCRIREWLTRPEVETLHQHILERLRNEGALPSRMFADNSQRDVGTTGWTSGRTVNALLDYLWLKGEVMVARRQGTQRLWDLAERCLPGWAPLDELSQQEVTYRAAQKALRALGVARANHIAAHFIRRRYHDLPNVLNQLEAEGHIERVRIKPEDGAAWPGEWFLHCDDIPLLEQLQHGNWSPRTTLLSPFDNLICDRNRAEVMFDFTFRIEIYVPKDKRRYGYYVLPILHGDRLIGRIDPLMDRKTGRLVVHAVHAEANIDTTPDMVENVRKAIESLAAFLGANDIIMGRVPLEWQGLKR